MADDSTVVSPDSSSSTDSESLDKITHFKRDSDPLIDPFIHDSDYDDYCRVTSIQRKIARHTEHIGSLSLLKSKYESLDYEIVESRLMLEEENSRGFRYIIKKQIMRWFVFLYIGLGTASAGFLIGFGIHKTTLIKHRFISRLIDEYVLTGEMYIPYLVWVVFNVVPTFIGSMLVTYVEPIASGSGIPVVKCYLNGVNIPRLVTLRTLFVRSLGVMCSIIGGLAGGNEGPMIHIGAIISVAIATKKAKCGKRRLKMFEYFREDREKRDFVSGGAAAGVAAAFSAPIGGVLFTLEEGSSFWNQSLTWRIFFASTICSFTLNLMFKWSSEEQLEDAEEEYQGMLNFGHFHDFGYEFFELPIFILMGCFGGLTGALWVHINYRLNIYRIRFITTKSGKVAEAVILAAVTATAAVFSLYFVDHCREKDYLDYRDVKPQCQCGQGELNEIAVLWLQTPEDSVRKLLHDPANYIHMSSLITFLSIYYVLSCWTFGLSTSNGLFVPSLLTGAAWGRLLGVLLMKIIPSTEPKKYALIGAAAQLGGVVRMTLSLTVILMEATGNVAICFPVILTLIASKWTGDIFNEGIYELVIQINSIPLLAWEAPPMVSHIFASEVMSQPPFTLYPESTVKEIVSLLNSTTCNGFPIIDSQNTVEAKIAFTEYRNLIDLSNPFEIPEMQFNKNYRLNQQLVLGLIDELEEFAEMPIRSNRIPFHLQEKGHVYGRIRGLILRSQLTVLLKRKLFVETEDEWVEDTPSLFRDEYPNYPLIQDIQLTDEELNNYSLDLKRYMNPSPYTLLHTTSLSRMFCMFRALGLRHLPIVDDANHVIGMVTRKDIAKYRCWKHIGKMGVEELTIVADH